MASPARHSVRTPTLEIAYEASGREAGVPVVLLHGFPDDPRAYDGSLDGLDALGCRILVPWLRGYGPTRFLDPATPRSGQQAALGTDLLAFLDALDIDAAILVGYDWGGRAACIVAALWPERCLGLVTIGGYNIQNIALANRPQAALNEFRAWYQHYFQTERGRAGLEQNRRDISRLLWELWSPNWAFDDATFERTAASFDNPDFVEVVVHSYRHRRSAAPGDPALASIEMDLARQPPIAVPTIALHGEADGLGPPTDDRDALHFTGAYQRRLIPTAGHFLPHEAPEAVVAAVASLLPGRHR
jgi:pimeloyl-ACP methyl ester carboxylesterase